MALCPGDYLVGDDEPVEDGTETGDGLEHVEPAAVRVERAH